MTVSQVLVPRLIAARLIARLHRVIVAPRAETARYQRKLWFGLSLGIAAMYGLLALRQAFSGPYVVQDDARQHVFWTLRFVDPGLFLHDTITDYFQSVAPAGYGAFYWFIAQLGLDPLTVTKFLPIILGLIATGYCFGLSLRLFPVPAAGFIAIALLNQTLWTTTTLASGTPRAFVYPMLLAFLYYLLRRSLIPCLVVLALQGLFYPQILFVSVAVLVLRLLDWANWPLRLSRNRSDVLFCAAGLAVALAVLLPHALTSSEFGPVITAAQARALPEFQPGGRSQFFLDNPWRFWIISHRSGLLGLLPWEKKPLLTWAALAWAGFLLPLLLRFPTRFPLTKWIAGEVRLLLHVVLASLGIFMAAHALLFRLHLPSRYTGYSLPVVLALTSGVALTVMLDAAFRWAGQRANSPRRGRQRVALGITALLGCILVFHPVFLTMGQASFPRTRYRVGHVPALYEFFLRQPKHTLIASLSSEADNLPTFAKRSVLVAQKYAIPYHLGYYRQMRQRASDLIRAQYTPDLAKVRRFVQTYGVDFWLLDRDAFTLEYLAASPWIQQYQPAAAESQASLEQGTVPALVTMLERCTVFETNDFVVLQAPCLATQES